MIAVIINGEQLPNWQITSMVRLQNAGNRLVLIRVIKKEPKVTTKISRYLKFLFLLESKILKSSGNFLKDGNINSIKNTLLIDVDSIEDINNNVLPADITSIISFLHSDEEMLFSLANRLSLDILKLKFGEKTSGEIDTIIKEYQAKAGTINVALYKFSPGDNKVKVYDTYCSLEEGMLLKTINSILAKCSVIFERFFCNNDNTKNLTGKLKDFDSIAVYSFTNLYLLLIAHLVDKVFKKRQWFVLYDFSSKKEISTVNNFKKILPPNDRIWADPFVVFDNDNYHIFIEELESKDNKGYISLMTISENGEVSKPVKVLETLYHLSFPLVFQENGIWYMIPETMQAKSVQLYTATDFPEKWEFKMNLLENVQCVDTVVKKIGDKWWLFCTQKPDKDAAGHEELHVYSANELVTNNWEPHPKNPVLSDARIGRNAGMLHIRENGDLIRYGQYSGGTYGKALTASKINLLTTLDYSEEIIDIVYPEMKKGIFNLHSFNFDGQMVVSDALRRINRFF